MGFFIIIVLCGKCECVLMYKIFGGISINKEVFLLIIIFIKFFEVLVNKFNWFYIVDKWCLFFNLIGRGFFIEMLVKGKRVKVF